MAVGRWCLGALLVSAVFAEKPKKQEIVEPAGASSGGKSAPTANVSKIQAWKDAELIASLAPGRTEVVGAGDSMRPMYGPNTILVISKMPFEELCVGMTVAYTNRRGHQVVHQLVAQERSGWKVQGMNNEVADLDRVTRENLIGVIYASLSYADK